MEKHMTEIHSDAPSPAAKEPPIDSGKTKATGTAKEPAKDVQKQTEAAGEEAKAAKAAAAAKRKETDGKFNKAKALKIRTDGAMAACQELLANSELDADWVWLKSKESREDLNAAQTAIGNFKSASAFWSSWALQSQNFPLHAKKSFDAATIEAHLKELNQLEKLIETFEKETRRLTAMHNARMSTR